MKTYWSYFKEFHSEYLKWNQYAWLLLFVGVLIALNYNFDIEDSYIDAIKPAILRFPAFLILHGLAYFGVLAILKKFRPSDSSLDFKHWLYPLFGIVVLSFDRSVFPHIGNAIVQHAPPPTITFWFKTLNNFYGWITVFLVLWLWYNTKDKSLHSFYGLQKEGIGKRFYALTGIVVIGITYVATLSSDMASFYPVYQRAGGAMFAHFYSISEIIPASVFEFFYLTDFMNTELMFRGFLVVGASQLLGRNAVLPMAATYAVLHFGKPMGETISSFFGGYILGVLALYTRNIWGGVFIHVLLALGMEFFAYLVTH